VLLCENGSFLPNKYLNIWRNTKVKQCFTGFKEKSHKQIHNTIGSWHQWDSKETSVKENLQMLRVAVFSAILQMLDSFFL
jgi:phage-related protein